MMENDQTEKISLKSFLNPITVITGLILFMGMAVVTVVLVLFMRDPVPVSGRIPEVTKIAAPTLTPTMVEPTSTPTPTPTSVFILPEGAIGVGVYVQVTGTGGAGLRMRGEPSLSGEIRFSAMESEMFLVIDGPAEADGYTWWHLEAPYDRDRNGWSAGDFLNRIEEVEN